MNTLHVKRDDTVIVISGDDKGVKGKVIAVSPEERKVIVEGANMQTKHVKPRRQGETGGIIKTEGAIYASKVMLYCPTCEAGRRVKHVRNADGERSRVCVKCGETLLSRGG